ncbi:MAG: hypothetical protein Q4D37_09210, partial [Oscillospiraceae bacterium]|nr:hypothetical protein [Oscillospiraceae bacterium]
FVEAYSNSLFFFYVQVYHADFQDNGQWFAYLIQINVLFFEIAVLLVKFFMLLIQLMTLSEEP